MTTAMKYTKLKGLTLHVNFLCMLSNRSFYYSKDFAKRPSDLERAEYLRDVLQKTNCELSLIKPIKP